MYRYKFNKDTRIYKRKPIDYWGKQNGGKCKKKKKLPS